MNRTGKTLFGGAFILDGPGTYVEYRPDTVVIGNRPGALLWCLTILIWCLTIAVGWLFWPHSRPIAVLPSVVMGIPPVLALLNRQRWEITAAALRMRGRALGIATHEDYAIDSGSRVRIAERLTWGESLPVLQLQVSTSDGDWIGVAESGDLGRLVRLADAVSAAAQLPLPELSEVRSEHLRHGEDHSVHSGICSLRECSDGSGVRILVHPHRC